MLQNFGIPSDYKPNETRARTLEKLKKKTKQFMKLDRYENKK